MKRETLKQILSLYYAPSTIDSLLSGRRTPVLRKAIVLNEEHNIPLDAWKDIKAYLSTAQSMPVSNNDSHYKEECPCT